MLADDINRSRRNKLVEKDKFDRHMKRARLNDIESRKSIFSLQTADGIARNEIRQSIKPSIY